MKEKEFKNNLLDFISKGTSSYCTVDNVITILDKNGYINVEEEDKIDGDINNFYIVRNDASIIAVSIPKDFDEKFLIISTHCDTPSLLLKPDASYIGEGFLKHNIMPYGGILNYGWLDHPLSLSGRIIYKKKDNIYKEIVDYKNTLAVVPSVAIHLNDKANTSLDLDSQIDMQPIFGLSDSEDDFKKLLNNKDIIDYDLFLYNNTIPSFIGLNNELLLSPRIDNLTSVYSGLHSFINSQNKSIKIFCSFNSEEIGNLTYEGADGNFLIDVIKKICKQKDIDLSKSLSNSIMISSDNTHGSHPNRKNYKDETTSAKLGDGIVIVKESQTSTDGLSSAIVKEICSKNNIKYQLGTCRNSLVSGSTLSKPCLRQLGALSVDIGISQLAMHSSLEVCSYSDIEKLYQFMKCFYESNIVFDKNKILIE